MRFLRFKSRADISRKSLLVLIMACGLTLALVGCGEADTLDPAQATAQFIANVQKALEATQAEEIHQATLQALSATQTAVGQLASGSPDTPIAPPPPTMVALPTNTAIAPPPVTPSAIAPEPPLETPTLPLAAASAPPTLSAGEFESWMKTASILLYEDIVFHPDTTRYVKRTLDEMGLGYTDVGSALGRLKSQMLTGGPQGQGWDLIIIASESKNAASGEFYQYASEALDKGSSVIYELWYLDERIGPSGEALLSRCGIEFQRDWKDVSPAAEVMYPVNDQHPIMHEPNDGLTFTKVTDYWAYDYDIGDLVRKSQIGGDATILVGTIGTESTNHGTLTVCVKDQLLIQTFSTHQLTYDVMRRVWENYIYNALRTRYKHLQE